MTEGQMERMVQLARACAAGTPPVAFSVSLDTTLIVGERERLRKYIASRPNITADDIHIHEYNETMMVERYPKLPEAQRKVTANGWGSRPAPFGFHTEMSAAGARGLGVGGCLARHVESKPVHRFARA